MRWRRWSRRAGGIGSVSSNPFEKVEPCWAGRKAFAGGRWQVPCNRSMEPTHIVTDPSTPGAPVIKLCTFHYEWVEELGMITNPDPTPEQIEAYERRTREE